MRPCWSTEIKGEILETGAYVWRVILTFFQKTFFGTTFSPLSLIKPCELLRTSGPIINKDLIGNTKGIA
jgi:hypothetical protein